MPYTIEEHKHRLAVWAAASAAMTSPLCRFTVEKGKTILEACGFDANLAAPEQLPVPSSIDAIHGQWRSQSMLTARTEGIDGFTDGVAAKLINCYLKVRFICGGFHEHERVAALHPPIDSLLLEGLAAKDVGHHAAEWKRFAAWRWSKLSSSQYQEIIDLIRECQGTEALWKIEEYWIGYR
jgi:hypothetical protein